MDIIRSQISEIKDLELIYIFSTDSVFKNETDKYLGARIVYNKNQVIALDYKSEYFEDLLRHVLRRYKEEKSTKKIILLGSLTKKFMSDFSFLYQKSEIQKKKKNIRCGIPAFDVKSNVIKHLSVYLKETIKQILEFYVGSKDLNVDTIEGYNNKYVVKYNYNNNNNELFILVNIIDSNKITFSIKSIEGRTINIEGFLEDDFNVVKVEWNESLYKVNGYYHYDTINDTITKKISMNNQTIFYDDEYREITKNELEKIKFYLNLCELSLPAKILKVNDNHFILTESKEFNENLDECFYTSVSYKVDINKDEIWIKTINRDSFSKYNNRYNGILSEKVETYTLKLLNDSDFHNVLIEKKVEFNDDVNYSHRILEITTISSFDDPFEIIDEYKINFKEPHLAKVKQYIKTKKKGE